VQENCDKLNGTLCEKRHYKPITDAFLKVRTDFFWRNGSVGLLAMAALAMAGWKSPATVSSPPRGAGCQQFATQKKLATLPPVMFLVSQAGQARDHFLKKSAKATLSFLFFQEMVSRSHSTNLRKVSLSFSRQLDLGRLRRTVPDSPDSPDSPELRVVHQVLVCSLFFCFLLFFCVFCFYS
jgi:hypothetical protein